MSSEPYILVPGDVAATMASGAAGSWGLLNFRLDPVEDLLVVSGLWVKTNTASPSAAAWLDEHYLKTNPIIGRAGLWYRVDPGLHFMHELLVRRMDSAITVDAFRAHVPSGWTMPGRGEWPVLTYAETADGPSYAAWWVSSSGAHAARFSIADDSNPLDQLVGHWPVERLADAHVTVVGAGSIGSAAAEALPSYGIGHLSLVDYDRLLHHNLVRHKLQRRDLGRHKINPLAEQLTSRWPALAVDRYPMDVVRDADVMRPLFARSDAILCAADGVTPRRVVNHLARRAGRPLVLACVLANGAIGEILRVTNRTGCLLCHRAALAAAGALDPEPDLDRGYGTGSRHLSMTAVGGDLGLVGDLAAKMTVATLLERTGDFAQRLPGDALTVALRPVPHLEAPFDLDHCTDTRWSDLPTPRADCPTCGPR